MDFSHHDFPNSYKEPFKITSPNTWEYNCIAWSLEVKDLWYWPGPHPKQYWPNDIPREVTVEAFVELYRKHDFEICDDGSFDKGFLKIALFVKDGAPTHAARQLGNDSWTSKLGPNIDVRHTIEAMEGGKYGDVHLYMEKKISAFKRRMMKVV